MEAICNMAPLSLKIVQGGGAITRTVLFDTTMRVSEAHDIVREKVLLDGPGKDYGLFLTSADDELSGVWLEGHRTLDYYMLRDGDSLQYLCRTRNLRVRMLDGSEKTMQIDESKCVSDLMMVICDKIGITNHDEYGLCFENMEEQPQEEKPVTGTLTLKRKQQTREKDAKLEQLSKKLKTDDNVEWLAQHKTLREIGVDPKETLLLKRRLFYSDRNVDSRDPVQLNLLYVQTRDAILDGRQVITELKAVEFAGIQCQVQYGDFQEDKHKPGFIENLKEFLPEQYAGSWGVERKVLKEHSKHQGLSPLDAKHLYTKNARELPTYGVTFFLVKEQQKGKKKLVPRLLGINAESILRLDEVTKEVLQVWMLTQVKTFRAGKETFTLDFGDYSDKEYTVKTNEAHRIRDILQGYIDIIHRSIAAPYNVTPVEGMAICEDNVQSSKGQIVQNIVPMKVVEQSYVGPSKLVPFVQGTEATQGTQIMTVRQMLITKKGAAQHQGIAGEVGVRGNNSMEYLKKLNRLNSNSVETVEFLTDPKNKQADKAQKVKTLATIIEEDRNSIIEGVHKAVENDNDEVKKKLLSELDELCANFRLLIATSKQNDLGTPESFTSAQESVERIVGLCTQMYCSLDPGIKRRSKILRRSHKSFIADEKTEATLRRASFLAAASHACKTVDDAKKELDMTFVGSVPEGHEVDELEREARKKIAKITAAVALLMSAQADPKNLDYSAAITSMTTVDELLPELIQDAKALCSVKDEKSRLSLLSKIRALCDAARSICSLTGDEDKEHVQELAYKYAKAADKLIFTFGRGTVADKENEILDLARDVGNKTSLLLMKTHELINLSEADPRAEELDMVGVRCADASKMLLACAQLTASSIDEPHCQSAMTAVAESLSSSAQHLAATWKPLVEEPGHRMFEESLLTHTMDLMKALDRLKEAYADLSVDDNMKNGDPNEKQKQRMKFIATMRSAMDNISNAQKELDKPTAVKAVGEKIKELQRVLGQRLSMLNASIASLICATSDREHPDYNAAMQAIAVVSEIMPELVQDVKVISATKDEKAGRALKNEVRELCEATRDVCSASDLDTMQGGNDASAKFARHSSNLCNVFIPRVDPRKENMIIDLSKTACEKASELLTYVNQLIDEIGGEDGQKLDACGAKLVDVVQALLTSAQITAPSFADPRCQSTMLSAADDVHSSSKELAASWAPLVRGPERQTLRGNLDTGLSGLETALNNLRAACKMFDAVSGMKSTDKERERLKFVTAMSLSKNNMLNAEKDLKKPATGKIDVKEVANMQRILRQRLAQLNAAIASLVRSTVDSANVDYNAAEEAIGSITQLLPDVINDTKSLSTLKDDNAQRAMLADLKKLFNATREICKCSEEGNTQGLNETALRYADASRKLSFVFNPQSSAGTESQIIDLCKTACEKASKMLVNIHQLAECAGGIDGSRLDECGVTLDTAAKTLLTTAEIIETSVGHPKCASTMLSAIDDVSASSQELRSAWRPIKQNPKNKDILGNLEKEKEELDSALNNLRVACRHVSPIEEIQQQKPFKIISAVKRVIPDVDNKKHKVVEMSKEVLKQANGISMNASTLASSVGGKDGANLHDCGKQLVDAAETLLFTVAEVEKRTGGPYNKYSILAAIDAITASSSELGTAISSMDRDQGRRRIIDELEHQREELNTALKEIRAVCKDEIGIQDAAEYDQQTAEWLTSIITMSDVKSALQKASTEFDKPVTGMERCTKSSELQNQSAQRLAQLNAAVASLIRATPDKKNTYYGFGEEAAKSITEVMPKIINDVKLLSRIKDAETRQTMKDLLKTLYDATLEICEEVDSGNIKNANETVLKFVMASRKLNSTIEPSVDLGSGKYIEDLSKVTCEKASQLLANVYGLVDSVEGENSDFLDRGGAKVVDAVQDLLNTARITAHTTNDANCKSQLLSSIEEVTSTFNALASSYNPLLSKPSRKNLKEQFDKEREELDVAIDKLKNACKEDGPGSKIQKRSIPEDGRLNFIATMSAAKNKIISAEKELAKPATAPVGVKATDLQRMLAQRLAHLNAAIASLIRATGNQANPDYDEAEKATRTAAELIPDIIRNSTALSMTKDDVTRRNMQTALKELCEAFREICLESELGHVKNAYEPITKYADSSSKLCYVFNPRADMKRENLIIELSKSACDKASVLLSQVYQLAESSGGQQGATLDDCGVRLVDAAQLLLTNAQITASSVDDPHCLSTLLSSADEVSALSRELADTWSVLLQGPERKSLKDQLNQERSELESAVNELRAACKDAADVKLKPVKPPVPKRLTLRDADQKNIQEEKVQFAKSVDEAVGSIVRTEEQIKKMYNESADISSPEATRVAAQRLERTLVLANVAASHLVFCNDPEKINYKVASTSAKSFSELFPTIAKDTRELANSRNLQAKTILDDTVVLCEAARTLYSTAKDNREKLNEVAVDFANQSAKLLYVIGTGVDPDQEKEVLSRAKVIGDCASRLASCGAVAQSSSEELCDASSSCANAASKLLYVCKLVATSLQYPESQNILLTAADQLSSNLKQFSSVRTPLSKQSEQFSCIKDIETEGKTLERLLDDLKHDIKNEKLVKRRKENILSVEDSPMRQLASGILDSYKAYVESPDLSMEERRKYAQDADKLSAAINELDVANAHCRNMPQDTNSLRRLEDATQNVQQVLLQCRRGLGEEQNNIVDLMDYVKEVVSSVDTLARTAEGTNGEHGRKELKNIKDECGKMAAHATKLTTHSEPTEDGNLTDDLILIDAFAQGDGRRVEHRNVLGNTALVMRRRCTYNQDCEKSVSHLNTAARSVTDVQSRRKLEFKTQKLADSVNMLRFAVKSALATAESAALDESLHDLSEMENRIDYLLQPTEGMSSQYNKQEGSSALAALCCAAASPHTSAAQLTPALAAYATEMRTRTDLSDPQEKRRLEKHLRKLLFLLKTLMMTTSRRMATWQEQDDGEISTITDQVIQELEDYDCIGSNDEKQQNKVVDSVDVRRLLLPPSDVHLDGDKNEISKKFHQSAAKLNSMMITIPNSVQKPQTLSRSLHATADVAIELGTLARALKNTENPIKSNRIEEAAKGMCHATYDLLKAAERVSRDPDRLLSRRRLLDACQSLNDSINKLSRATDSKQEGNELIRNLQLQQTFLQNLQPPCAHNYAECVEALQNQSDVIYKLKSDQAMSREEGTATLQYITSAVCNASEYAVQCAYLLSISDKYKDVAREGLPDLARIQKVADAVQDVCVRIMCLGNTSQVKDFASELNDHGRQLQEAVDESKGKIEDLNAQKEMVTAASEIDAAIKEFNKCSHDSNSNMTAITSSTLRILDATAALNAVIKGPTLIPQVDELSSHSRTARGDVIATSRELLDKTVQLVKETSNSTGGVTSWKTVDDRRKAVLQAFDTLIKSINESGCRAGLLDPPQAEEEEPEKQKSYMEIQVDSVKKWLKKPTSNEEAKSIGIEGVRNIVKIAEEMAEDLKGLEKEEMRQVIHDVEKLSKECSIKYDKEKSSLLLERLLELRKMLERVVVTRVVEDFLEDETTLGDFELLVDVEKDEEKRKYLLKQKIAELLAQMNRVTRTARLVADAGPARAQAELTQCSREVELLAPSLVKATEERINSPHHQAIIDNHKAVMAQYADSMSKVRILCDRSVDPIDFVQAAGETMQRVHEESRAENDPLKSAYASNIVTRLGWRVLEAGMSSNSEVRDPELRKALQLAQLRLQAASGAASRTSRPARWDDVTAEILRTTSEVESALCGENIFQKQLDPNQPIFAAALDLHAAVREWSARDNEIVAVAKRMAVLMARLSDYMNHDKKREVIATSKAIVKAASEVAALARKLALECTDVRIRTNLLQVCDRIPTISAQLKMLTTVKGSSLGQQGNQEDKEAINMLVGNAQNLMQSIQEVVNAAAGASVKIMSQRAGPRLRWVRKNYYNY